MAIISLGTPMHNQASVGNNLVTFPKLAVVGLEDGTVPQYQHHVERRFFGELIESFTGIPDEIVDIAAVGAAGLGLVAAVAAPFALPAILPVLGAGAAVAGGVAAAEGVALAGEAVAAGGIAAEGAALAGEAAVLGGAAAEGAALAEGAGVALAEAAAEAGMTAEEAAASLGMTMGQAESYFEGDLAWESMSSLDLGPPMINIPRGVESPASDKMQYVAMVCPTSDSELPACRVAGEFSFHMKEDGSGPEIEPEEQLEIMRSMLMLLTQPEQSELPPVTVVDLSQESVPNDKKVTKREHNSDSSQLALWVDLNQAIQDLQEASLSFETTTIEDDGTFTTEGYKEYNNIDPGEVDEVLRNVFMDHLFPVTEHPVKADEDGDDFDVVRELLDFGFSLHKDWLELFVQETPSEAPADEKHGDKEHGDKKHGDKKHGEKKHGDEQHADEKSADEKASDKKPPGRYVEVTM